MAKRRRLKNRNRIRKVRKSKKPLLDRRNLLRYRNMMLRNGTGVFYKPDDATMRIGARPVPDEQVAAEGYEGDQPGMVHHVPGNVPPRVPDIPVMAAHQPVIANRQPAIIANPDGPPHVDFESMYEQIMAAMEGGHRIPIPLLLGFEPEEYVMVSLDVLLGRNRPVNFFLRQFVPPQLRHDWPYEQQEIRFIQGARPVPDEQVVAAEGYEDDEPGMVRYFLEPVPPRVLDIPVMAVNQPVVANRQPAIIANPDGPPHVDFDSMYEQILAAIHGGHRIPIPLLLGFEREEYVMVSVEVLLGINRPVNPFLRQFVPPELRQDWQDEDEQEEDEEQVVEEQEIIRIEDRRRG